jgi:hypothetical protein
VGQIKLPKWAEKTCQTQLETDERPEGLFGRLIYASEVFDRASIRRILMKWVVLLSVTSADPSQTVMTLSQSLNDRGGDGHDSSAFVGIKRFLRSGIKAFGETID